MGSGREISCAMGGLTAGFSSGAGFGAIVGSVGFSSAFPTIELTKEESLLRRLSNNLIHAGFLKFVYKSVVAVHQFFELNLDAVGGLVDFVES